ncbi:hypothetical protein [Streptomyces sp. NRRL S-350]|uniref:hypothetical protein n=1 Tax=Streptomyces sp. NRRL S-350 TaxID=1463902 RepID=UPI00131B0D2D|nr:hypothetical protein [Streptomyces sp. NRRL S-350]
MARFKHVKDACSSLSVVVELAGLDAVEEGGEGGGGGAEDDVALVGLAEWF